VDGTQAGESDAGQGVDDGCELDIQASNLVLTSAHELAELRSAQTAHEEVETDSDESTQYHPTTIYLITDRHMQ
jgi:hypothetical protein